MKREEALERVGVPYAVALRLRDARAGDDVIAAALGVEPEAVTALLEVADAKLASMLAGGGETP